jgi:hypothetical protein
MRDIKQMNTKWRNILHRFLQSTKMGMTLSHQDALSRKKDSAWGKSSEQNDSILPLAGQIEHWRKAVGTMTWNIEPDEFDRIGDPPEITFQDIRDGFTDIILSYGFGKNDLGDADPVLSGKMAWEYAIKSKKNKTWKCEHFDFDRAEQIRLRPKASPRPSGFYFAKFRSGERYINLSVSQLLARLQGDTGCGPEGIQLLTITHPHFVNLMNERKMPFMALADYDIAPYGHSDFFDTMQMFCSNGTLGLGIGNVDTNYPRFGIPTLRFHSEEDNVI